MLPFSPPCLTPDHVAEIAAHPLPAATARPRYADRAVCIEPAGLAEQEGVDGTYDQTRDTTHFHVVWDASNADADTHVLDLIATSLETSWTTEIDQMGWLAPDQTDACLITVIVADLTADLAETGGWTNVNEDGGVPYMVLNTDWAAEGDEWVETLVAHEFNHASQFAYDVFWEREDWWYWESTAEWSTDLVYDDANTWIWSLWAYADAPWLALDSNAAMVQYGHFAFNVYLEESIDADAPRAVWVAAQDELGVEGAVEAAHGVEFDDVLLGYTSHVAAIDVDERDVWLEALGYFETDLYVETVTTYPASGGVEGREAPQGRGQNFLHFGAPTEGRVEFTFTGVTEVEGVATEWGVTVATVDAQGVVTHTATQTTGGAVAIPFAEGWTDAYVGVIPMTAFPDGNASYTWTAVSVVEEEEEDTDEPVKVADEEKTAACGCAGTGAEAGAAWILALGVTALRSRRRAPAYP